MSIRGKKMNGYLPSKLCEYNDNNQLICKICQINIKTASFWNSHQKSIKHTQKLQYYLDEIKKSMIKKNKENNNESNGDSKITKDSKTNNNDGNSDSNEEELIDGIPKDFYDGQILITKSEDTNDNNGLNDRILKSNNDDSNDEDIDLNKIIQENNTLSEIIHENQKTEAELELKKLEDEIKLEEQKRNIDVNNFIHKMDSERKKQETLEIKEENNFLNDLKKMYNNMVKNKINQKRTLNDNINDIEHPKLKKQKLDNNNNISDNNDDNLDDIFDDDDWRSQKV